MASLSRHALIAFCVAAGLLAAGAAQASAASVTVKSRDGNSRSIDIGGSAHDVNTNYTVVGKSGSRFTVPVDGISIRSLLEMADADPAYSKVVIEAGGKQVRLTRTQIENTDLPPAAVYESGGQAAFIRPSYGPGDANANDLLSGAMTVTQAQVSTSDGPVAKAIAAPAKTEARKPVTFTAEVSNTASGEQFIYRWNFDDGTSATGAKVRHAFKKRGTYRVLVTATPVGEDASVPAAVKVQVGAAVESDKQRSGNGTNESAGAPATGAADGDSGSGDQAATETQKKERKKEVEPVDTRGLERVSGELLSAEAAPGTPVQSTLAARSGQQVVQETKSFGMSGEQIAVTAAVLLLLGGALMEFGVPQALHRRIHNL